MRTHKQISYIAIIFVIATFSFSSINVIAQSIRAKQVRAIDSYVRQLDRNIKRKIVNWEAYAEVSLNDNPHWKKFRTTKDFERWQKNHDSYSVAYVAIGNGRIVVANFTFSSASGDWAHYIFHYFRADGTLAKIKADLRTFNGDLSVKRSFWFDQRGKLLKKTVHYADIATDKPKKPGEGFYDNEVTIFKSTRKLPFRVLVQ